MSSAEQDRPGHAASSEEDPFRYGWRYLKRARPDGSVWLEEVPLTLEDVLYPEEEDRRVQRPGHADDCIYLREVFRTRVQGVPGAFISFDLRIAWPEVRPLGPDITVIFNVRELQNWGTFDVEEEGTRPEMVIEVTSPDTRGTDVVDKMTLYHRAKVPWYVIVDAAHGWKFGDPLGISGFRWRPSGWEQLSLDERGFLWLEPVRLWLGCEEGRVVCYDELGRRQGDLLQVSRQLQAEERARAEERYLLESRARAAAEDQKEAEARSRAAAEERARAEAQTREAEAGARAEAEQRAAAEAQARAEAEQRAAAAQAEVARLLERLRALEGHGESSTP